jgi:hypothetical protein
MMSALRNSLLLMFCISFTMYLGGFPNNFTVIACHLGVGNASSYLSCAGIPSLFDTVSTFLITGAIATVIISFLFPNPYTMFLPLVVFMFGFVLFPVGIFNEAMGFPWEISLFFSIFYAALILFALINFARGSGDL